MKIELVEEFSFNALHKLPYAPAGSRSNRPHEHNFQVDVAVEGEIDLQARTGNLIDYEDIHHAIEPLVESSLEDSYLNQIEGLENPTAENIARWLWVRLKGELPGLKRVSLRETCTSECDYTGN